MNYLLIFIISIVDIYSQEYTISEVAKSNKREIASIEKLLNEEGIKRDKNLDYTCAVYDENYNIVATGSCFGNTLRCVAVSKEHQGEGLVNKIFSHLIQYQFNRGIYHIFLYTKCSSSQFFRDMGFYEIVRIKDQIVFMENKKTGIKDYITDLTLSIVLILVAGIMITLSITLYFTLNKGIETISRISQIFTIIFTFLLILSLLFLLAI